MQRKRVKFTVYVDLDPVPGTFHTQESAQHVLRNLLNQSISHYKPVVNLAKNTD